LREGGGGEKGLTQYIYVYIGRLESLYKYINCFFYEQQLMRKTHEVSHFYENKLNSVADLTKTAGRSSQAQTSWCKLLGKPLVTKITRNNTFFIEAVSKDIFKYLRNFEVKKFNNHQWSYEKELI
jgi:hypothetical protein